MYDIITIKSQKEFDELDVNSKDIILIRFGDKENPAIINKAIPNSMLILRDEHFADIKTDEGVYCTITAYNKSTVRCYSRAKVYVEHNAYAEIHTMCDVCARDFSTVSVYADKAYILASNFSEIYARNNTKVVLAEGNSIIHLYDNSYANIISDSVLCCPDESFNGVIKREIE